MKVIASSTLQNIIRNISDFEDKMVLFVGKEVTWSSLSKSHVYSFEGEEQISVAVDDFLYFLEIYLVKEVIDVWKSWTADKQHGLAELIEAVIFYAENDSYKPCQ